MEPIGPREYMCQHARWFDFTTLAKRDDPGEVSPDEVRAAIQYAVTTMSDEELMEAVGCYNRSLYYQPGTLPVLAYHQSQARIKAVRRAAKAAAKVKVVVQDQAYLVGHGRSPRGSGQWLFSLVNEGQDPQDPKHYRKFYGTYTQARKQAVELAKVEGVTTVVVMP